VCPGVTWTGLAIGSAIEASAPPKAPCFEPAFTTSIRSLVALPLRLGRPD
jgi:hypothetical protein